MVAHISEPGDARESVGRMGSPEEAADAVAWLCSVAATLVVGHATVI